MAEQQYTFAQRNDVDVKLAFPATPGGTTPGEFSERICIDGDFTINDSYARETLEVSDWCSRQTPGAIQGGTDGARTVTANFTLQMILADATFQDFMENYELPNEPIWIQVERRDRETNVTTWTETLRGRTTQANRTDRGTGTSQVAVVVEVHEIVNSNFNTAA